jgi:TAG lipase/steryl ester hydrolase/phospholipase A2/LPA acyltransferase
MSELFNVNTFIVSQVNPHVIPFLTIDGGGILESNIRNKFAKTIKALIGNEIKHWINQLSALGLLPSFLLRITHLVTQQYKGHITIVPNVKIKNYLKILSNPNMEDYHEAIISSYCSTFSSKYLFNRLILLFRNIFN